MSFSAKKIFEAVKKPTVKMDISSRVCIDCGIKEKEAYQMKLEGEHQLKLIYIVLALGALYVGKQTAKKLKGLLY